MPLPRIVRRARADTQHPVYRGIRYLGQVGIFFIFFDFNHILRNKLDKKFFFNLVFFIHVSLFGMIYESCQCTCRDY
jgi:phosphate starvation-inducible membrane PsiE